MHKLTATPPVYVMINRPINDSNTCTAVNKSTFPHTQYTTVTVFVCHSFSFVLGLCAWCWGDGGVRVHILYIHIHMCVCVNSSVWDYPTLKFSRRHSILWVWCTANFVILHPVCIWKLKLKQFIYYSADRKWPCSSFSAVMICLLFFVICDSKLNIYLGFGQN